MRCVVVVVDGDSAAGEGELWSALGSAPTPVLDRLGESGRVGAAALTPGRHAPGDPGVALGTALLTLLGSRAGELTRLSGPVFEAVSRGVDPAALDAERGWAVRAGLVGVSADDREGVMLGEPGVSGDEADAVFGDVLAHWREAGAEVDLLGSGPSRVLLDRGGGGFEFSRVETVAPGLIVGEPWIEHLPDGGDAGSAERLCALVSATRHGLAEHPINLARAEQGLTPANLVWLWAPGTSAGIRPIGEMAGVPGVRLLTGGASVGTTGTVLAETITGAGGLIGLGVEDAGGLGSLARRIVEAEDELVVAAVGGPIERVDAELLEPLLAGLEAVGGTLESGEASWRVMVVVSHDPGEGPAGGMSPFVLAGGWVRGVVPRRLCHGLGSDLLVDPGCELLEYVLRSGLRGGQA